ncbi:MAG: preprotein translocase subunit YajC [Chloroflexi bacterium]|nr:preprotein translocase subunit YajC [Chloroflexota bacterium]
MQEFALLALVMVLALGAYWAMIIFPKQRDFQKRQHYVRNLNIGDEVVTYGGIIGRVVAIEPDQGTAQLEIASGVVIRILTAALVQPYDPEVFASAARKGFDDQPSAHPER